MTIVHLVQFQPWRIRINNQEFATGDRFYDREDIRRDLRSRILSGQTNVIYGLRRYGKSSLVAELAADLEKAGISCVLSFPAEFLRQSRPS